MYAIVEVAGLQYKVAKNQRVFVHRLEANEGASIELDKVLLIDNSGKITVGSPVIDGARVAAKVLSHLKGDKVIVFKKKRRKGYQKMNGHRQQLTELLIQAVLGKGEKLSEADAKLEVASILTLKERSRVKPSKKVWNNEDAPEAAEEVAEEKPKKAAKKAAAKKPAAKKAAKKKNDD
ncbi:MAG: 50S ribosomal protein L21 [Bacteroidia bacterium]|jgi:large subunit ribosomal protein L21|nr:50S ribosomal protein L21 [Bacteroidia bacterium]